MKWTKQQWSTSKYQYLWRQLLLAGSRLLTTFFLCAFIPTTWNGNDNAGIHSNKKIMRTWKKLFSNVLKNKPFHYLRELMATTNKVGVGEDLVRHRFTKTLPSTITWVIATATNLMLKELDTFFPFMKRNIVQNTTSECYKRQTQKTINPNTEMHIGVFYFMKRHQVWHRHLYFGKKSKTCKPWGQWTNKAACKIQPNSKSMLPARRTMLNEESGFENF